MPAFSCKHVTRFRRLPILIQRRSEPAAEATHRPRPPHVIEAVTRISAIRTENCAAFE